MRDQTVLIIGGPMDGARFTGRIWGSIMIHEDPDLAPADYAAPSTIGVSGRVPVPYRVEQLAIFGRLVLVATQPGLAEQERLDLLWKHLVRSDVHDLAVGSSG